ncbi:MAG: FAD-dependent monooxygenase [Gammaproteobacteria bacterium]|nr:FAD-dependent monooxygenase [Gammaproteobacteria bacterium]
MNVNQQNNNPDTPVRIAGAGPAGLAAAITLAQAGRRVVIHEAHAEVGYRFQGDLQGLENWSSEQDALEVLRDLGLATTFARVSCDRGIGFDAWGERYDLAGKKALFYLVERGPGPRTLDSALLAQAQGLGVEVRFDSRLDHVEGPAILATGPKVADAIAVGYHFDTDRENGFWVIYDDDIAPRGYAYLLIMNGRGTVKSCMFTGFKQEKLYVERTVAAFQRLVGLEMDNPQPHGGAGNFRIPERAASGGHPVVGEQAGFQDFLWGFGMRFALVSGVLAARSLLQGEDYDRLWRRELGPQLWNGQVNRAIFAALGNRGYRWILRRNQARHWDAHRCLHGIYQPWPLKRLLLPWAQRRLRLRRKDASCNHVDCACVWCRHGKEGHTGDVTVNCPLRGDSCSG